MEAVNDCPGLVEEDPRVDAPPHEIERPDPPESPEDEDAWNDEYLGKHVDGSPSLEYDVVTASRGVLAAFNLTVSEDARVHFNSTEGVVTLDDE